MNTAQAGIIYREITMRMKSVGAKCVEKFGVASVVLLGLLGAAYAAPKTPVSKPAMKPATKTATKSSAVKISQMTGTVISASRSSLTIKPSQKRYGAKKTISVPASAAITLGSKKVALSSLKAGEKVVVTMKGSTVMRISAAPGSAKPHMAKTHKA
jgi:hypothetical protein